MEKKNTWTNILSGTIVTVVAGCGLAVVVALAIKFISWMF